LTLPASGRNWTHLAAWHRRADEGFGDPPPKVDPGAVNGQREMEDPQEDPLAVHCFCVCSGSAPLGDLLGVSRSMEHDLLSVLSIYPRIFVHVFIVYHLLVGFFLCYCTLLYIHVCLLFWVSCQYLPSDWLKRPLWWHLYVVRRLRPQSPGGRDCVYFSFVWFAFVAVFSPGPTRYKLRRLQFRCPRTSCIWNSLPAALRAPDITLTTFRNKLKTFLFNV